MAEVRSQNDRKEHDTVTTPRHLAQFSISRLNTVDIDSFPTCDNDAHTSDSNEMECDGGFRSTCNYVVIMLCRGETLYFYVKVFVLHFALLSTAFISLYSSARSIPTFSNILFLLAMKFWSISFTTFIE